MKLLERLLVATDFSSGADDALQTAVFVARNFHSEVILLHVIPNPSDFGSIALEIVRKEVATRLQNIADRIRAEGIPTVKTVTAFGVPFDQIDQQAEQLDVNVIIMGSGPAAEQSQFHLGTTAARVRRNSNKPVWIVRPDATLPVNKILCPVDFSHASSRALRNAIHLSRCFQAELTVLTVIPRLSSHYESVAKTIAEKQEIHVEQQRLLFGHFVREFDFHNVCWNQVIRLGEPHREILKATDEMRTDLLVMGSVGRTWLSRILMGGVARKVAQKIPCSIITVRSEHAIRLRQEAEIGDMESHHKQGHELLDHGFPEEALSHFQHCVAKDMMGAHAWKDLAAVHERLGHLGEAERCECRAKHLTQALEDRQIEADIRSHHPLFGKF